MEGVSAALAAPAPPPAPPRHAPTPPPRHVGLAHHVTRAASHSRSGPKPGLGPYCWTSTPCGPATTAAAHSASSASGKLSSAGTPRVKSMGRSPVVMAALPLRDSGGLRDRSCEPAVHDRVLNVERRMVGESVHAVHGLRR